MNVTRLSPTPKGPRLKRTRFGPDSGSNGGWGSAKRPMFPAQFTPPYPAGIGKIPKTVGTSSNISTVWVALTVAVVRLRANKTGAIEFFILSFYLLPTLQRPSCSCRQNNANKTPPAGQSGDG